MNIKNIKIKNVLMFIAVSLIVFFANSNTLYAKNLSNNDFGGGRDYFYRYGWCYTGYAVTMDSRPNVISETEYVTRMNKGENMAGYGIGFAGEPQYGQYNAYNARETFNSKDVWDPFQGGKTNYSSAHGYHGSDAVLLQDGERLPCYVYEAGSWAQVKYYNTKVWLPIFAKTYTGTYFEGDDTGPSIWINSSTASYASDSNNYSDSTEDFVFSFSASDGDSGINHLEFYVEQRTSGGGVVGSYRRYSVEGPDNGDDRNAWNETVTGTINLGKLYGITKISVTAYNGAGASSSIDVGTYYVDRFYPNAPTYSFQAGKERPLTGINDPFNLQIVYQDDIDTSGSSGSSFSGIKEIYYYISQDKTYNPSLSEYTRVNSTTVGRNTYVANIQIAESGNWYVWMKAVDYAGHSTDSFSTLPFVVAKIDPVISIEPDTIVDIGAYSTLKVIIHGLTEEQINNPETKVQIEFPTWWDEDPYLNDGVKYIYNKSIDTTKMIRDMEYSNGDKTYLYYFNFIPPMAVLEGKTSVTIPIKVQIITPGFGYDKTNTKLSVVSTITLTIKNTKNLSTYITENA